MIKPVEPAEALPEPTAELMVIGGLAEAFIKSLPPRKRVRFLAALEQVADEYEGLGSVVRLRGARGSPRQVVRSRREGVAWLRAFTDMMRQAG